MTFQLDTTGGVGPMPGWFKPIPTSNRYVLWDDLSPVMQGYTEEMFAGLVRESAWGALPMLPHPEEPGAYREVRFCDLSPETLAQIIADCERFQKMYPSAFVTVGGRGFWTERQAGGLPRFLPLTVLLGDDGKVRFAA